MTTPARVIKVLANDGMDEGGLRIFRHAKVQVDTIKVTKDRLASVVGEYDGVVVRSATKMTAEVVEAGAKGSLKIIGRQGSGTDNVDKEATINHGIILKTSPEGNAGPTAELAMAHIFALARKLVPAHIETKYGQAMEIISKIRNGELDGADPAEVVRIIAAAEGGAWNKKKFQGISLTNRTLCIIGCGYIGKKLAAKASGIGMNVVGVDDIKDPEAHITYLNRDEAIAKADFISIHVNGTGLILGEHEFSLMKPTAYVVNAARAENIDPDALYHALKEGRIAGAGLDVHEGEPEKDGIAFRSRFDEFPNVIFTQHQGPTKEATAVTSADIAQYMVDFLIYRSFANAVNIAAGPGVQSARRDTTNPLLIFHDNVPRTFSQIDDVIGKHGINIHDFVSEPMVGKKNAVTIYDLFQPPTEPLIAEISSLDRVRWVKQ